MDKHRFLEPVELAYQVHSQSPYGDMWQKMSTDELASAAAYKSRRVTLLPIGNPKRKDDIIDAICFLIFAYHQNRR